MYKKIVVDGKKISQAKLEILIGNAINSIILSGFATIDELDKITRVNARDCEYLVDMILYRLQVTYSDNIDKVSKASLVDISAATNVGLLIDKLMIILELIKRRRKSAIPLTIEDKESIESTNELEIITEEDEMNIIRLLFPSTK